MANDNMVASINDAIGAHGTWKMKLKTAIRTGKSDINPHDAGCDDRCKFGQWLHGPTIDAATRQGVPYGVIKRLHADFHRSAAQVLQLAVSGQPQKAEAAAAQDFTPRSEKLIVALNKWKNELS